MGSKKSPGGKKMPLPIDERLKRWGLGRPTVFSFFMNPMRIIIVLSALAAALLAGIALVAVSGGGTPFSIKELDDYAQVAVDLDEHIRSQRILEPQKYRGYMAVLTLEKHPTSALEVWRKLRPLLEKNDPGPADFGEMSNHSGHLSVLADIFGRTQAKQKFQALFLKTRDWKRDKRRSR